MGTDRTLSEESGIPEEEEASIWEQHLRLVNPEPYKVDLSGQAMGAESS